MSDKNGVYRQDILDFAVQTYGTKPEFLWSKYPDYGVLRHSDNNKWYAVIMGVSKSKLGLQGNEKVDVLEVKCEPLMSGSLLREKGVLPAYHMKKGNWLTVLLDGSADKSLAFALLQMSYELTKKKQGTKVKRTIPKEWVIPANPKLYDIEQEFSESEIITWHQSANFIVGDTVFIYMTAPLSSIMYECEVIEADIPHVDDGNPSTRKRMKILLKRRFEEGEIGLPRMRELGVQGVRGARGMPHALSAEIAKIKGN